MSESAVTQDPQQPKNKKKTRKKALIFLAIVFVIIGVGWAASVSYTHLTLPTKA